MFNTGLPHILKGSGEKGDWVISPNPSNPSNPYFFIAKKRYTIMHT
jgi:hypothetical protein